MIKECADQLLKKSFVKRNYTQTLKNEPIWFTKDIESGIKKRREFNRLARNAENDNIRDYWRNKYLTQKALVKDMVKEAISNYEMKLTNDIKQDKNGKKMWNHINKLRKKDDRKKEVLYDEQGQRVDCERQINQLITDFWTGIYQQHDTSISTIWNDATKISYRELVHRPSPNRIDYNNYDPVDRNVSEWLGNLFRRLAGRNMEEQGEEDGMIRGIGRMDEVVFTEEEVKKHLSSMKGNKQAGLDLIKPEIYKWLGDSQITVRNLTDGMNGVISNGTIPEHWKKSKTVLIPKKNKPNCTHLRPISLNDISYKLFMSLVKEKIYEHMKSQSCILEFQAGFTKNRRIEDNILILRYCVSESFRLKKSLYVAAIDFAKAFDSIDRLQIIKIMMKYRCNPLLIEAVAQVYSGDRTEIWFQNRRIGEMEVTSGIRQGCTCSPWLFVMVMKEIIEKLIDTKIGFRNEKCKIPILMFADDGLIIAQSKGHMKVLINTMNNIATEMGMRINRDKSVVLLFNSEERVIDIEGIKVEDTMKYLGVTVKNIKDCFKAHKEQKIKTSKLFSNMTYSVIQKSCNKLTIGKTYWDSVVMPAVMYGTVVVTWNVGELKELQREENKVWRFILGGPGHVSTAAMRGDMGAGTVRMRDMKAKLKYTRSVVREETGKLTKTVIEDMFERGTDKLVKVIRNYMSEINISNLNELKNLSEYELCKKIREFDENVWKNEMMQQSTMELYRQYKNNIRQEIFYDNTWDSVLLFRARSDSLNLGWRERFRGESCVCEMCDDQQNETLVHFIIYCAAYDGIRDLYEVQGKSLAEILLFVEGCNEQVSKKYLSAIWKKRNARLREIRNDL